MKPVEHYVDKLTPENVHAAPVRNAGNGKTGKSPGVAPASAAPSSSVKSQRKIVEILDAIKWNNHDYLHFRQGERDKWVDGSKFAFDEKVGLRELKNAGIFEYGAKATRLLIERIGAIGDFREQQVIDHYGWTSPHFALQSGLVISPAGIEPPPVVIPTHPLRVASHGSPVTWRKEVAGLFTGHPIGEFMLCAAFAPQLMTILGLNGNVGVGLAGGSSTGKSTLQLVAASAYGPASDSIGHYRYTLNSTVNALDELMSVHHDALLVLDEMGHMDTPVTLNSAKLLYELIMRLGAGDDRRRMGDAIGSGLAHNLLFTVSANKTLPEALSPLPWANIEAAMVRLVMIPVPDRPSGVFEHIPHGFSSVKEALQRLRVVLLSHYGVAIRRYLARLVQKRANDSAGLVAGIARRMDEFVVIAGGADADGQNSRIIQAFALISAAGDLAKHYRVLPLGFHPQASALACLDLVRQQQEGRSGPQTIIDRLLAWLQSNSFYDLRTSSPPRLTQEAMDTSGAFVAHGVRNRVEVQLTQGVFRRIFPDYSRVLASEEAKSMMIVEKKTYQTQRTVRQGHSAERVYCFVVPAGVI